MPLLICSNCGNRKNVADTTVAGMALMEWWEAVGKLCWGCRALSAAAHPYAGQVGHVRGSDTSEAAGQSQEPTLHTKQATVLKLLREYEEGCTDDELEHLTGWRHQTVSARRRELVLAKLVVDTGKRRLTSSGRSATVWTVQT